MVTEGVVHGVDMTRSPFGVIRQHKESGGTWTFYHCDTSVTRILNCSWKDRDIWPSVNNLDEMGRSTTQEHL